MNSSHTWKCFTFAPSHQGALRGGFSCGYISECTRLIDGVLFQTLTWTLQIKIPHLSTCRLHYLIRLGWWRSWSPTWTGAADTSVREDAGLNINAAFRPEQPAEHGGLTAPRVNQRVEPEARAAPSSATWRCDCTDADGGGGESRSAALRETAGSNCESQISLRFIAG